MKKVALSELRAACFAMFDKVQKANLAVLASKFGKPVAEVTPPSPVRKSNLGGFHEGRDQIPGRHRGTRFRRKRLEGLERVKLLLDTHIRLWAFGNAEKLSKRVRRELENPANEIWGSAVSAWETQMLHSKRRIHLPPDLEDCFRRALSRTREAPLAHEIVFQAHNLALPHKDPADRFLAATAKVLDLILVTQDPELLGLATFRHLQIGEPLCRTGRGDEDLSSLDS